MTLRLSLMSFNGTSIANITYLLGVRQNEYGAIVE
jgi:hypothetical protein